jgi:hypothetical protein
LRGVSSLPQVYGYIASTPKDRAQVLLSSPDGDPLLATWQYGLGRSLVWTSDVRGRWARDWVNWDLFPQVASQMIHWLTPPQASSHIQLETRASNNQLALTVSLLDDKQRPTSGAQLDGQATGADGHVHTVALREIGPGQYHAIVPSLSPGSYQVQVNARTGQGEPFAVARSGALVASREHITVGGLTLLESLAQNAGGRINMLPQSVYDAMGVQMPSWQDIGLWFVWLAVLLLPMDIAMRRLPYDPQRVARTRAALEQRVGAERWDRMGQVLRQCGSLLHTFAGSNARLGIVSWEVRRQHDRDDGEL